MVANHRVSFGLLFLAVWTVATQGHGARQISAVLINDCKPGKRTYARSMRVVSWH